jgi:RNA polymerase sigma factor (sigma-70 family)
VDDRDWLAQRFEQDRTRLRAVAYRMLGSFAEADDAVQEAWLRLARSDADAIENLSGWLTTVVGRVCLDMLRSRRSRREEPLDVHVPDPVVEPIKASDPEQEAMLADSAGDFEALVNVLAPDIVVRADGDPGRPHFTSLTRGAETVASRAMSFANPKAVLHPALVNGAAGVVVTLNGHPFSILSFTVVGGKIVAIDGISDPDRMAAALAASDFELTP